MRFTYIALATTGLAFLAPASTATTIDTETTATIRCGAPVVTQSKFKWYASRVYSKDRVKKRSLKRLDRMRNCSMNKKSNHNMLLLQKALGKKRTARKLASRKFPVRPHLRSIAQCESGGNIRAISPSGKYRGKYQFSFATWQSVGGQGDPAQASEYEQDKRAEMLYKKSGPGQWPVCQG